jgi:hypothetical protein
VRAYGRDLIRAKGIMASGACQSRIKGRTHGRTNQQKAEDQNATFQRRARRAKKVAAVALANKTARTIWALMTNGERYREPTVALP